MSSSLLRSASRLLHSSAPATAQLSATRRAAEAVAAASAIRIDQSHLATVAAAGFPQVAAHSTAPLVVPAPAHGASSAASAARVEQPSIKGPGPQAVTKFAETDG